MLKNMVKKFIAFPEFNNNLKYFFKTCIEHENIILSSP